MEDSVNRHSVECSGTLPDAADGASADARDAARYRWLRDWDGRRDYLSRSGLPWVVHVVTQGGVPTMQPMYHQALDYVIDDALKAEESTVPTGAS